MYQNAVDSGTMNPTLMATCRKNSRSPVAHAPAPSPEQEDDGQDGEGFQVRLGTRRVFTSRQAAPPQDRNGDQAKQVGRRCEHDSVKRPVRYSVCGADDSYGVWRK